jgi:hypothetical protein
MNRSQGAQRRQCAARSRRVVLYIPRNLSHQREGISGPAGAGGRDADDDCTADDCTRGHGGLCGGGIETACWEGDGGGDDIFCLMSSSTACSAAMF